MLPERVELLHQEIEARREIAEEERQHFRTVGNLLTYVQANTLPN